MEHKQLKEKVSNNSRVKYIVKLTQEERDALLSLVSKGKASAKKITHARILLQVDESANVENCYSDSEIAKMLHVSTKTVSRVRKSLVEGGLESALNRKPHSRYKPRRLDGEQEAHLIALVCSNPPEGRARWTISLLTDKLVELKIVDSIGRTAVHETLKKMNLSLG